MSFSGTSSSDDNRGQSTGESVWRLHSVSVVVAPCDSRLNVSAKYTNSNARKENEIHLLDNAGNPIYSINHTNQLSIFDLPIK